jgi:hypothetical protein
MGNGLRRTALQMTHWRSSLSLLHLLSPLVFMELVESQEGSAFRYVLCTWRNFTPTFTLLNPCYAGFAEGEIQQGESSPFQPS